MDRNSLCLSLGFSFLTIFFPSRLCSPQASVAAPLVWSVQFSCAAIGKTGKTLVLPICGGYNAKPYTSNFLLLEPLCYKKWQKKVPEKLVWGIWDLSRLNDTKLILNDSWGHTCSFRTNLVSLRTFRCIYLLAAVI